VACLALGVGVALPEPYEAIIGTAALVAATLALIQPLVALPLLLFAVPFGGFARGASADPSATSAELSFGAAELVIALLGATWLARGVRRRALSVRGGALVGITLAMIALALLSIGYAQDRSLAIKESLKWLELLLALVIVVDLAREPGAVRVVIGAMLIAGAAEAAYGAFQFVTDTGPSTFALRGALRAFGHFDQPNPFAGYLATMLPLGISMVLCPVNPRGYRWLSAAACAAIGVGIGLSQSRGAWLGVALAAVCLLVGWSRFTRRLLIPGTAAGAFALALALAGVLPAAILDRLSQLIEYFGVFDVRGVEVSTENWAVVERMAHWQAGWNMFEDHPWLGVGAGNYAAAYAAYFIGPWREALGHAHNYYVNILAELGVAGGAVLLLLLGVAFLQLGRTLVRSEDAGDRFWRAVLAGVFGGLVVFSIHNLFDSLFVHSVNIQMGVLLGLGVVAAEHLKASDIQVAS
jgi:O-antigen ligase